MHVTLLGDSVFDNRKYTYGAPAVIDQVRELLPRDWTASLLAADGAIVEDVPFQASRIPAGATHLVLSAGGNDAIFEVLVGTSEAERTARFETNYRNAIAACKRPGVSLTVCTIYGGCFHDPAYQRMARVVVPGLNEVILRLASEQKLSVIDLRKICTCADDYTNEIEPSVRGGAKIAEHVVMQFIGAQ
jgi:hypothetical protein